MGGSLAAQLLALTCSVPWRDHFFSFQYTQSHKPWSDILNTTELPPACPQHMGSMDYLNIHYPGFNSTSEDCLYLNIYVPKVGLFTNLSSGKFCMPVLSSADFFFQNQFSGIPSECQRKFRITVLKGVQSWDMHKVNRKVRHNSRSESNLGCTLGTLRLVLCANKFHFVS